MQNYIKIPFKSIINTVCIFKSGMIFTKELSAGKGRIAAQLKIKMHLFNGCCCSTSCIFIFLKEYAPVCLHMRASLRGSLNCCLVLTTYVLFSEMAEIADLQALSRSRHSVLVSLYICYFKPFYPGGDKNEEEEEEISSLIGQNRGPRLKVV